MLASFLFGKSKLPFQSHLLYLIEVDEDVKEGSIIGQVTAYDPDAVNNLIK